MAKPRQLIQINDPNYTDGPLDLGANYRDRPAGANTTSRANDNQAKPTEPQPAKTDRADQAQTNKERN